MNKIAFCLLAWLLLASLPAAHARGLADLPADAVIVDPLAIPPAKLAGSAAVAKQAQAALAAGPASALAVIAGVADPVSHALAAAALIDDLQKGEGDAAARDVLQQLAKTPLRVFRRHEETAADWFLPYIDVAGRARFALRLLDARSERERWTADWETDPRTALTQLKQLDDSSQGTALEGLGALPPATTDQVLAMALKDSAAQPTALWPVLAAATGDLAAFNAAAKYSADRDLLGLLAAPDRLSSAQAVSWLLDLMQRPSLASAALLALAAHAEHDSAAWQRLVRALDEPLLAPSAAAALAQRPQLDRVARIVTLAEDASTDRLAGVVLALRLEGSPEAMAALAELRSDPRLPAATRAELSR